jgi:hypothetical protein
MMRANFLAVVLLRRFRQQIRRARARTIIGRKFGLLLRPLFSQQYPSLFEKDGDSHGHPHDRDGARYGAGTASRGGGVWRTRSTSRS